MWFAMQMGVFCFSLFATRLIDLLNNNIMVLDSLRHVGLRPLLQLLPASDKPLVGLPDRVSLE